MCVGHAIIGTMEFPVLGYEEDAVDGFGQLALLEYYGNETSDLLAYVPHYIDFWMQSEYEDTARLPITELEGDLLVGAHDFSTRRAARLACNIAGSAPQALSDIATRIGITRETLDFSCTYSSAQMFDAWRKVLDLAPPVTDFTQLDPERAAMVEALGIPFEVSYEPWPDNPEAVTQLQESRILEDSAEFLRSWIELPKHVRVVAAPCGTANAFFEPTYSAVVMCYELWEAAVAAGKTYPARVTAAGAAAQP